MSRTKAHGVRIMKVAAYDSARNGRYCPHYQVEIAKADGWVIVAYCEHWHSAVTELESWQEILRDAL